MCRYAFDRYPTSMVCVPCRHVASSHDGAKCPSCQTAMVNAGMDFKAPRKRDTSGWDAVAAVLASGRNYDSCGCHGPGPRPATRAEVRRESMMRPLAAKKGQWRR